MIPAILILLFVIGFTYRKISTTRDHRKTSFFQRHRIILLLIALVVLPVIILNLWIPHVYLTTPEEILEEAKKSNSQPDREKAYQLNLHVYPDSLPLYFEFIDFYSTDYYAGCDAFDSHNCPNIEVLKACNLYKQAVCEPENKIVLDEQQKQRRFYNYIAGVSHLNRGEPEKAVVYFERETTVNPDFTESYLRLRGIYRMMGEEKYRNFLASKSLISKLPVRELVIDYYNYGLTGKYIEALIDFSFFHIHPLAFFAALFISIIWLIFIRSMDLFNRESWTDIIVVFSGGALFAFLCLPIYHFAEYSLGFELNGEGTNDFLYCTLVIGGAEETVKLIPWVLFALLSGKMKEPYDYILYASASALGFAFAENWMYLESSENIVGRSIMSTASHMFDASIIAYSFILAKYRFRSTKMQIALPVLGFLLAMFSHGFYDFWLISPSVKDLFILTILFFILSMHIWFYMKNNATNHSAFFVKGKFNGDRQVNMMLISFMAILMLEFTLLSFQYGAYQANSKLAYDAIIISFFLSYMTVILLNYQPVQGVWEKLKIPVPTVFRSMFSMDRPKTGYSGPTEFIDMHNRRLSLFAPKSNKYVGSLLPVSGTCVHEVAIEDKDGAYLLKLERDLGLAGHHQRFVVVMPMLSTYTLAHDKIQIYLLLIPDHKDPFDRSFNIDELRYTGRVYSRPM